MLPNLTVFRGGILNEKHSDILIICSYVLGGIEFPDADAGCGCLGAMVAA